MQEHLQKLLLDFQNFTCLGLTSQRHDALNNILENKPSIVFLDIDKKSGIKNPFNFVHELHQFLEELPAFVAVSSSKTSAYDVLKNNFQDYLLKPIDLYELRKCIMKYEKMCYKSNAKKICVRSYSDYRFLNLDDILFLKADNNTTDFHLIGDRKITAYKTLKIFEEKLPLMYLRVHHSYIVNTNKIIRINYGKSLIALESGPDIPFSRSYRSQVEQLKDRFSSSLSLVS